MKNDYSLMNSFISTNYNDHSSYFSFMNEKISNYANNIKAFEVLLGNIQINNINELGIIG